MIEAFCVDLHPCDENKDVAPDRAQMWQFDSREDPWYQIDLRLSPENPSRAFMRGSVMASHLQSQAYQTQAIWAC
jgi:hypothetical protein